MDDENIYILSISKLKKVLLKKGENSQRATDGSVCCVIFIHTQGDSFKHSMHTSSATSAITIGTGFEVVDRVLEYCIQSMTVSEESTFSCDVLNIEFTAFLESCTLKPHSFQMSDLEKISLARFFKEQGINLYKKGEVSQAFFKFRRALQYVLVMNSFFTQEHNCNSGSVDKEEIFQLMLTIYNNLALCHLQYKNYNSVIPLCSKALMLKPNEKAYYRRAIAFIEIQEYENAENDLIETLKLDSKNKIATEKLKLVRELQKHNVESYKETVKKMFSLSNR